MPTLYRCRTSLRETAALFRAVPPERADWAAEVWPGRVGLIVRDYNGQRHISPAPWGIPDQSTASRTTLWYCEWASGDPLLRETEHRCLIIADSFALPDGPPSGRTRTWYGFDNAPIFAWAGLCWGADGYCGFQVSAPSSAGASRVMPAIVEPEDYDCRLGDDWRSASVIVRRTADAAALYCEPTEQPWGADRMP